MIELKFAKCCGNCIHSSRPKKPEDHAAHYDVSKTERWCYLHNQYITRECVCDSFDQDNKRGGVPACKRVFAFNRKLVMYNAILATIKERYGEDVKTIDIPDCMNSKWISIVVTPNNILGLRDRQWTWYFRVKDSEALKNLEFIEQVLKFKEKTK